MGARKESGESQGNRNTLEYRRPHIVPALILAAAALAILGAVLAVLLVEEQGQPRYEPGLLITGDLEAPFTLSYEDWESLEKEEFQYEGEARKGVPFHTLLEKGGLLSEDGRANLLGRDGMMASFPISSLSEGYILFSDKGWEAVHLKHPPSSNVKEISRILVTDETAAVPFTDRNGRVKTLSAGSFYLHDFVTGRVLEGTSQIGVLSCQVYTSREYIKLSDFMGIGDLTPLRVTDSSGRTHDVVGASLLSVRENVLSLTPFGEGEAIRPASVIVAE